MLIPPPPYCDKAVSNARRLQRMWECEIDQAKSSGKRPSLAKCVWKFCRTRILISSLLFLIAACFQFIAPVRTKNYIEQIEFVFTTKCIAYSLSLEFLHFCIFFRKLAVRKLLACFALLSILHVFLLF